MHPSAEALSQQVRELESAIQRAAFDMLQQEGSYDQSQQLLTVASDVRNIAARLDEVLSGKPKPAVSAPEGQRRALASQRARRNASSKYPIIFVADNRLVKIGKGKQKSAKEYRHEAPRSSFDTVARWIEATTLTGTREWMARTADEQLGDQVPTYQTYLVITALQKVGVLRPVRRGWYTLANDAGGPEDWWRRLAGASLEDAAGGDD